MKFWDIHTCAADGRRIRVAFVCLQALGVEDWTVDVLCSCYLIPFHSLPRVFQDPVEFPSYGLGFIKAQALQDEVDKMPGKGFVELLKHPVPGYYSCLFLVQKVTRGWRLLIGLSALSHYVTLTSFKMETVNSFLGMIRKGMLHSQLTSRTCIFRFLFTLTLNHTLDCLVKQSLLVEGAVFWPFHSSPGLHQSIFFSGLYLNN